MADIEALELTIFSAGEDGSSGRRVAAVGKWAAFVACVGLAAYGLAQVLQVIGTVSGLLADSLIFASSLVIAPAFLIAIHALDAFAAGSRRFFSRIAISFSTLYAGFAVFVYVVQLASIIPARAAGSSPMIFEVTPHSFFWTVDALAYISMGVAALFAALCLPRTDRTAPLFWAFVAHAAMTPIIALVYFYPVFSIPLLLIGSPWLFTAVAMTLLLGVYFRRLL